MPIIKGSHTMYNLGFKFFALLLLCLLADQAWALSCYQGAGMSAYYAKNRVQTETISNEILVPNGMTKAGTILWRSQTYSTQFTCFDTDSQPGGESAYLYWNPDKTLNNIHHSIELGVTINGIDYPLSGARLLIGTGTSYDYWNGSRNCSNLGIRTTWGKRCARPETLLVKYSIFIRSTGSTPPKQGNIPNTGSYSVFQVDGQGGLNRSSSNANFQLKINGLNRIRFVECNPRVTIEGNAGNSINFGRIYTKEQNINQIIARKPFTIKADLSRPDTGGVCNGKMLVASFSAANLQDNTTILPEGRKDIGIQIFKHNQNEALAFKTPVDLAMLNNGVAQNQFDAGILQLAATPKAGQFNAVATVEITFK